MQRVLYVKRGVHVLEVMLVSVYRPVLCDTILPEPSGHWLLLLVQNDCGCSFVEACGGMLFLLLSCIMHLCAAESAVQWPLVLS